jgi:hypothetical protein
MKLRLKKPIPGQPYKKAENNNSRSCYRNMHARMQAQRSSHEAASKKANPGAALQGVKAQETSRPINGEFSSASSSFLDRYWAGHVEVDSYEASERLICRAKGGPDLCRRYTISLLQCA